MKIKRSRQTQQDISQQTQAIIDQVKQQGDAALRQFSKTFDKVDIDQLAVNCDQFDASQLDQQAMKAIEQAIEQVKQYHQSQIAETVVYQQNGLTIRRETRAIQRVGLYVPGGTAPLISTLIMLAIPAKIAGCSQITICTPPNADGSINPYLLATAKVCGIEQLYRVGGAQAIAAMAYGTESINKVDKIFGPGNQWVTQAKLLCSQNNNAVSIDMPAGPSELLIIADNTARAEFIAADLLSQAEHGVDSQVILLTDDETLAAEVKTQLQQQLKTLPRQSIANTVLENSQIIVTESLAQAMALSNDYAPEHLSLQCQQADYWASQVKAAGSVFIGNLTAESLGDYITGSNHVLPTAGFASSVSGLSLNDFLTTISFQQVTEKGLSRLGAAAAQLAQLESLQAHANAVTLRLQTLEGENYGN